MIVIRQFWRGGFTLSREAQLEGPVGMISWEEGTEMRGLCCLLGGAAHGMTEGELQGQKMSLCPLWLPGDRIEESSGETPCESMSFF